MVLKTGNVSKEEIKLSEDIHIKIFESMVKMRLFEEKQIQLYHEAKIRGYLHPGVGNEATDAGEMCALNDDDIVYPTHRGHGIYAIRGADMGKILAELMAKSEGYCSGFAGSCHLASPTIRPVQGILGASLPLAIGEALAIKLLGEKKVVLCRFGDGAANNGTFHESLNMASIWKLPVVFICLNNLYAVSFSFNKSTSVSNISLRAQGYSMPGYGVDGTDYEEVYKTVKKAVNQARAGGGPSLIEVRTRRTRGHHPNDSGSYRSKEELEEAKKQDPLKKAIRKIKRLKILDSKKIEDIYHKIREDIGKAAAFAENSPLPSVEEFVNKCRKSYR